MKFFNENSIRVLGKRFKWKSTLFFECNAIFEINYIEFNMYILNMFHLLSSDLFTLK
jgi:hypothetical protein